MERVRVNRNDSWLQPSRKLCGMGPARVYLLGLSQRCRFRHWHASSSPGAANQVMSYLLGRRGLGPSGTLEWERDL